MFLLKKADASSKWALEEEFVEDSETPGSQPGIYICVILLGQGPCKTWAFFSVFRKMEMAIASSKLRKRCGDVVQGVALARSVQFGHTCPTFGLPIAVYIVRKTKKNGEQPASFCAALTR